MDSSRKGKGKKEDDEPKKNEDKKVDDAETKQKLYEKLTRELYKEACELSLLCGAEVAILAQAPRDGELNAFGSPNAESAILRFLGIPEPAPAVGEGLGVQANQAEQLNQGVPEAEEAEESEEEENNENEEGADN